MAQVKRIHDNVTAEPFYLELRTRRMFRRIVGAIAWPHGETPGSVLVLGEIRSRAAFLNTRHDLHILYERQSDDVQSLIELASRAQDEWHVFMWHTPLVDQRIYLLDDYNDSRRIARQMPMTISDPLGWSGKGEGLLPVYFAMVQRRTLNEKTLFFGPESAAAVEIQRLDPDEMNAKPTDYPSAAALFWSVAAVDMIPIPEWGERLPSFGGPADPIGGY